MDLTSLIVIGVYTLIYVIVFIYQKTQIDTQKTVIQTMKTFSEIFKVDEVKKYVDLKSEISKMEAAKFIADEGLMMSEAKKFSKDFTDNNIKKMQEDYEKQMGEEHLELVKFAIEVIARQPKDKRKEFINLAFPKTKRYFITMLDDIN